MDNYVKFTFSAPELYRISKSAFYKVISDCEVNFVVGHSQMFISLKNVAYEQTRVKRRGIMVLFLTNANKENISKFSNWLSSYFSPEMQAEIFELIISDDGTIKLNSILEKALNKYRKR